jgi:hemerythrin-like domain-containing protein
MEFIDFRVPAQGFRQPLMLWTASHDRAQRVALLLQRLFEHLRQHGPSQATRVTAGEVRRFMDEAAPRHHQDEDVDLFPRLRRRLEAANGSAFDPSLAQETALTLERLERDHPVLDDLWVQVRAALVHADSSAPTDAHCACAEQFVGTFLAHHGVEDQIITPIAEQALQPDDLAAIGEAMAARRGTTWAALSQR